MIREQLDQALTRAEYQDLDLLGRGVHALRHLRIRSSLEHPELESLSLLRGKLQQRGLEVFVELPFPHCAVAVSAGVFTGRGQQSLIALYFDRARLPLRPNGVWVDSMVIGNLES